MSAGRTLALLLLPTLLAPACRTAAPYYEHSRYDYAAFRARMGSLPEPNYLPWLMHTETLPDGGRALVACRWANRDFPLRYHVATPIIPSEAQDEFDPRDPQDYVVAVHRAFRRWEQALGRPVRFQAVDDPEQASLRIQMSSAERQGAEGHVLGMLRGERERCRVVGPGPDHDHVRVEFSVDEAYLFVSDRFGLLTPGQVQAVALHEIGHILGASGQHSPLRGDLMYKVASDRRVERISEHDRNSLLALYRIEPGAIYVRLDEEHGRPLQEIRRLPPRLGDEIVDERFGFSVRFPRGWQTIRSSRGQVAVDGVSWDHGASIQLIALRGNLAAHLEERARVGAGAGGAEMVMTETLELDGQPVGRVVVRGREWVEETDVLDWEPGWVLLLVAECRRADYTLYEPWFRRVLLSITRSGPIRDGPRGPTPG